MTSAYLLESSVRAWEELPDFALGTEQRFQVSVSIQSLSEDKASVTGNRSHIHLRFWIKMAGGVQSPNDRPVETSSAGRHSQMAMFAVRSFHSLYPIWAVIPSLSLAEDDF